jgi:hypothetical protein
LLGLQFKANQLDKVSLGATDRSCCWPPQQGHNSVADRTGRFIGQDATPQQRQQLRADLGLDSPFPVQFARFVGNAVRGEFGLSLRQGRKVSSLIA